MARVRQYDDRVVCLSRRCGLCRFPFVDGDGFTIIPGYEHRIEGLRYSEDFIYDGKPEKRWTYKFCHRGCTHKHARSRMDFACHETCMEQVSPYNFLSLKPATAPDYDPSPQEDQRRIKWLHEDLAPILFEVLHQLPAELRWEIAKYCLREHAVGLAERQRLQIGHQPTDYQVTTAKSVWVNYVEVEGVRYVASLTNTPRASEDHEVLFINKKRQRMIGTLYIAEDYIGIRELRFSESKSTKDYTCVPPVVSAVPGVWWRAIPLLGIPPGGELSNTRPHPPRLTAKGDRVKLRFIETPRGPSGLGPYESFNTQPSPYHLSDIYNVAWTTPQHLTNRPYIHSLQPDSHRWFRMAPVEFNNSGISGYSFGWSQEFCLSHAHNGLCFLHAHTSNNLDFYQTESPNHKFIQWFHIPISEGEVITHIWQILRDHRSNGWRPSLVFVTNFGQEVIIGPYPDPYARMELGHPLWANTCAYRHEGESTRMLVDGSAGLIQGFAFEGIHSRPNLQRGLKLSPLNYTDSNDTTIGGFRTFASLQDVVKVTPCRFAVGDDAFIGGLLLEYSTGRRACVGQCRLDSLEDPLVVEGGQLLWLGLRNSSEAQSRIIACDVGFADPSDRETTFVGYSQQGTLEWRTFPEEDIVIHRP